MVVVLVKICRDNLYNFVGLGEATINLSSSMPQGHIVKKKNCLYSGHVLKFNMTVHLVPSASKSM